MSKPNIGVLVARGDVDALQKLLPAGRDEALALVQAFRDSVAQGSAAALNSSVGGRDTTTWTEGMQRKMQQSAHGAGAGATLRLGGRIDFDENIKHKAMRQLARKAKDPAVRRSLFQYASKALPDVLTTSATKLTRVSDSLGISPGGRFVDDSGAEFYAKRSLFGGVAHLREELATVGLYQAVGAAVVDQQLKVDDRGEAFLVSPWQPLTPIDVETAAHHPDMARFFVMDAWLANWDVIGATSVHNIAKAANGSLVRVEGGAGMRFSGVGDLDHFEKGFKFGEDVVELKSFLDPKMSTFGPTAYRAVTPAAMREQALLMRDTFTPARIDQILGDAGCSADVKQLLSSRLLLRLDSILKQLDLT